MEPSSLPFCLRRGLFAATGGIFFCHQFFFYASGGELSFSSERKLPKNAGRNQWFLHFLPGV